MLWGTRQLLLLLLLLQQHCFAPWALTQQPHCQWLRQGGVEVGVVEELLLHCVHFPHLLPSPEYC